MPALDPSTSSMKRLPTPLLAPCEEDMRDEREADQTQRGAELDARQGETTVANRASADHSATNKKQQRDPLKTLTGCERILILGRTGSGKTTLARELAAALGMPHVELDSLYFGPDFSRAPLSLLRERDEGSDRRRSLGHGRQQARRARLGLASSGHNHLARLPRVYELVAARQTCAHPYLGAQRAGRSDRSKDRTAQADARSRERGAHGAQITSRTTPGIPVYVHPAGEPASRCGTPAFTPCYSSMDGSRHRGGPPARVGASGADRRGLSGRLLLLSCNAAADGSRAKGL
jgi:hypothetical protein